jgi:hypothetical protein
VSTPLYFLPGADENIDAGRIADAGLAHAIDVGRDCRRHTARGPGGQAGMLLAPAGAGLCYDPKAQTWHAPMDGGPIWWFGWANGDQPGPADLARPSQYSGHPVTLGDGRPWLIPAARMVDGGTCFPRRLRLTATGFSPAEVQDAYLALWTGAGRIWDAFTAASAGSTITLGDGWSLACDALSVNYRVGKIEIDRIGLLTDANADLIMRALVDWPSLEGLITGKAQPPSNSEPGGRD